MTADQIAARAARQGDAAAVARAGAREADADRLRQHATASSRTPSRGDRRRRPNPMEPHPRVVFERLFGEGGSAAQRLARRGKTGSMLDSVIAGSRRGSQKRLGAGDRTKLGEYLQSVREIEQRIQTAEAKGAASELALPDRPTDIPDEFEEHAKLMFDLQVLAFQADITRVFSMLMAREAQPADLSADRRARAAPPRLAPPRRSGADRQEAEDRHLSRPAARLFPREAGRRRTATARCSITR